MIRNIKKMFVLFSILSITPFMRGCSPKITFGFPFPIINVPTDMPGGEFGPFPFDYQSVLFFRRYSLYSYNRTQNNLFNITALALNFLIIYLLVKSLIAKEKNAEKTPLFLHALFVNLCCAWSILFPYLKLIHIYYIWYVPLFIVAQIFNLMARLGLYKLSYQIIEIPMDILIRIWFIIITVLLARLLYFFKKNKNEQVT